MNWDSIVGLIGAIVAQMAVLPQIVKSLKLKRTNHISLLYQFMVWVGSLFLVIHFFEIRDVVGITCEMLSLILVGIVVYLIIHYRKKD